MAYASSYALALFAVLSRTVGGATLLHRGSGNVEEASPSTRIMQVAEKASLGKEHGAGLMRVTAKQLPAGMMPIETQLMGMTPTMIQAMYTEMTQTGGPVSQAVNFVRSHPNEGWSWCANDGQTCWCNGQARFGTYAGGWPSFTNPLPIAGSSVCNGATMKWTLAARPGLHCQCQDVAEKTWQNTKLRFNSVSYLQEAWIQLTRVMSQAKLLPLSGDRNWGGEELFGVRGAGCQFRQYMDVFLAESAQFLPQNPVNCIEWAPMMYMPRFPACANVANQFHLDFTADPKAMHIAAGNHVKCDNVHLPGCMGATKFDVALNTNVWEHEQDPFEAMTGLYNVMNPGGVMLFTVPFAAPYHGVPFDFYRYTKSGVVHVLERAGFCVPRSRMASGGDFISDISLFSGIGPGDFSSAEMMQSYKRGYDNIPDGAIVVMAVAYKKLNANDPCPA